MGEANAWRLPHYKRGRESPIPQQKQQQQQQQQQQEEERDEEQVLYEPSSAEAERIVNSGSGQHRTEARL